MLKYTEYALEKMALQYKGCESFISKSYRTMHDYVIDSFQAEITLLLQYTIVA